MKTGKRTKKVKQDEIILGPVSATTDISFESFLALVAQAAKTTPSTIDTVSLQWKPANAKYLPLGDSNGLRAMMRQLEVKGVAGLVVYIKMDPPRRTQKLVSFYIFR